MAESIQNQVVDNLLATLKLIRGSGYTYDMTKSADQVTLWGAHPEKVSTFPTIIAHLTGDVGDLEQNCGYDEHVTTFTLACAVKVDSVKANARRHVSRMKADIQRALMADHTRGGTAWDTRVKSDASDFDDSLLPVIMFHITVEIYYRHGVKDPTSLAPTF